VYSLLPPLSHFALVAPPLLPPPHSSPLLCFLFSPSTLHQQRAPKTPAHSEEYTNAVISNNRIRKSHLYFSDLQLRADQMRLYSRICKCKIAAFD